MNFIEGLLLALLIFPATCLAGYSLAGWLVTPTAGVRVCLAALAGLGIWLWLVTWVNVFLPVSFGVAWLIVGASWLGTALLPPARRALVSDIRALRTIPGFGWCVLAPLPLLAGLLLPMVSYPGLVFHDGTSNHDSFFWVTAAEWLQQHTYLVSPNPAIDPAMFSVAGAITGTTPAWGRMGTEGLFALLGSAVNHSPLDVYVYVQAGLLPLWLASVVIFARMVLVRRLPAWVFVVGASFQSLFVFFVANNSMPNLLGALVAPVMLVAFVRLTETGLTRPERVGWGGVAALMLHSLLCTYPEMAPFALLPVGIAVLMKLFQDDRRGLRAGLVSTVVLAGLASVLIQPLSAWRAYLGFWNSFHVARTAEIWGNLFDSLEFSAHAPALVTLNVPAAKSLGPWLGWALSLLLLIVLSQAIRRAHDKTTALASLSGFILLAGYTLATDFGYGWQKAVQFSGVIVAGYFSYGFAVAQDPVKGWRPIIQRHAAIAIVTCFMAYATIWGCVRSYYWAGVKGLDAPFMALRDLSRGDLRERSVEVVGASFSRPFFYSMWAVYALPDSFITFDPRGEQGGGYLRDHLPRRRTHAAEAIQPRAYLVSRAWADTFDSDAVRLSVGSQHALLRQTNKVVAQTGVWPESGVPENAKARFSLTVLPYADSVFEMEINVQPTDPVVPTSLSISYGDPDQTNSWQTIRAEYPWQVKLPMRGGSKCQIDVVSAVTGRVEYPLRLSGFRVVQ